MKTVRSKNELELKYGKHLEDRTQQMLLLKDHANSLEKELNLLKLQHEAQKNDFQKHTDQLKQANKHQVESLLKEISLLNCQVNFDDNKEELMNLRLQNDLLSSKLEKSEKMMKDQAEQIERVLAQKALSSVESLKEIEKHRKETDALRLEKEKLELRNEALSKENESYFLDIKKSEQQMFDLTQQKLSLQSILDRQKDTVRDLEEQLMKQKQFSHSVILEKTKDAGQRDTELQTQISELKQEIRNLTTEKDKIGLLHEERLKGVAEINQRLERKVEESKEEITKLKGLILELESTKQEMREKLNKYAEKIQDLSENCSKSESTANRAKTELEKFYRAEEEGLLISQKQRENLEINQKLVEELKSIKIQNIKLKKAFTEMNNKLVDTVSEKVVMQARLKQIENKVAIKGNIS